MFWRPSLGGILRGFFGFFTLVLFLPGSLSVERVPLPLGGVGSLG